MGLLSVKLGLIGIVLDNKTTIWKCQFQLYVGIQVSLKFNIPPQLLKPLKFYTIAIRDTFPPTCYCYNTIVLRVRMLSVIGIKLTNKRESVAACQKNAILHFTYFKTVKYTPKLWLYSQMHLVNIE